jgi:hypothetical protein
MIKLKTYSTLLECFEEFIGKKVGPEEEKINYWVGHDGKKPFRIRFDKWLKTTRKCWGWTEYKTRTIHLWADKDCPHNELVVALAHEIGHFQRPRYFIKADEEKKASLYELVTRTALEMALEATDDPA